MRSFILLSCCPSMVFWVVFLMGMQWFKKGLSCPPQCVCTRLTVDCTRKWLPEFPMRIPFAVRELLLAENRLNELPHLGLSYLAEVVYLDCSYNAIEIGESFRFPALWNLVYLDLSYNFVTAVTSQTFSQLKKLLLLNLSGNAMIKEIDSAAFVKNSLLGYVDMSNCGLESINVQVFDHLTNLQTLALKGNPWVCNCSLLEFCSWIQETRHALHTTPQVELIDIDRIACNSPEEFEGWQIFKAEEELHRRCLFHLKAKDYIMLVLFSFLIYIVGTLVAGLIGMAVVIYQHPQMKTEDDSEDEGEDTMYSVINT